MRSIAPAYLVQLFGQLIDLDFLGHSSDGPHEIVRVSVE